jgi:hypothetical protein
MNHREQSPQQGYTAWLLRGEDRYGHYLNRNIRSKHV